MVCVQQLFAQKKIVFEKIRCYNGNQPLMQYLQQLRVQQEIASHLNQVLGKYFQQSLTDTSGFFTEWIDFNSIVPKLNPDFKNTDTSVGHLYIDLIENDPFYFFRKKEFQPADTTLPQKIKTVFGIKYFLVNAKRELINSETMYFLISNAETAGMGFLYHKGVQFTDLGITEKTFTDFFKKGITLLFDPKNEMLVAEMKLQPAFLYDDYILPKTSGKPRIYPQKNKEIVSYALDGKSELIRFGEPQYLEVRIKGKKTEKYPAELTAAIRATENFSNSDYVFLEQLGRDVLRDKNYLVHIVTQINPERIPYEPTLIFTNFLPGNFHYLLQEKDTVARFSILKEVNEIINHFYPQVIGNGIDSSLKYILQAGQEKNAWSLIYAYVINGSFNGLPFRIKCSGSNHDIREFFIRDKPVCIAQGKFYPEKFVLLDGTTEPEMLNRLFLIGFNRFLE